MRADVGACRRRAPGRCRHPRRRRRSSAPARAISRASTRWVAARSAACARGASGEGEQGDESEQAGHAAFEPTKPGGGTEVARLFRLAAREQCGRDERSGAAQAPLVADRARAGRRRLHRRRLPDRGAAGARPALLQPLGQPVRHLRRDERRLADRLAGGQRRHARADDAHGQRPGAALAAAAAAARCCCASTRASSRWKALKLPLHAISVARNVGGAASARCRAVDLVLALGDALPSGIYTGEGVEDYLRKALSADGRTDDFRLLERELYLAATDLDTCERIVLGAEGWDDIPISAAVRASTALPMIYAPYRVRDRELVDGGIVSTTNLDIAVEAGAKFIVVVNPLVPVRQRLLEDDPDPVRHPRAPRLGHGLPEDRLPDVQAARLPAPARDGRATGRSATRASTSCSSSPTPTTS